MKRYWKLILLLVFLTTACPSVSRKDVAAYLNNQMREGVEHTNTVSIHFATNRQEDFRFQDRCDSQHFLNQFSQNTFFGVCKVRVPGLHAIGSLEHTPQAGEATDDRFVVEQYEAKRTNDWFDGLSSSQKPILLFVHGFNVDFNEAILRAAQIAFDLRFSGDVVLYTWPAGQTNSGLLQALLLNKTYEANYDSAIKSRPLFKAFYSRLLDLKRENYIIVHSMGHQVVLPAIKELSEEGRSGAINELIMNAPDFPADEFLAMVPQIKELSIHTTMYCSPSDNALEVSSVVNKMPRAGSCMRVPGIDVINVKRIDDPALGVGGLGHGYYSSRAIITDLNQLLLGVRADRRLYISTAPYQANADYVLRN